MSRVTQPRRRAPAGEWNKRRSQNAVSQKFIFQTIAIILAYAVLWTLFELFLPEVRYIPSIGNVSLLILTIWAALQIKVSATRYIFLFWCLWFVLGSISLFAQNQLYRGKNYNLDPSSANFFYLTCVFSAILGAYLIEFFSKQKRIERTETPKNQMSQVIWFPILAFPIFFVGSIIYTTGTIPILSGEDVSYSIYEQNYGWIYSLGVYVPVACSMIWMKYLDSDHWSSRDPYRYITLVVLVFFVISASADGKRIISILAIGSIALFYLLNRRGTANSLRVSLMASVALFLYVLVQNLRTGSGASSTLSNSSGFFATIGVEYRDFIYSFENFDSNVLFTAGYDWLGSTLAAATPSVFWTILGTDKSTYILHDSARTLMVLFKVKLGIRIGLPGELWFYIGWWTPLFFLFFGMLIHLLALRMLNSRHIVYKSIMIVQLVIFMLSVNGQSTFTFGLTLPLLYLATAVFAIESGYSRGFQARRGPSRGTV